MSVRRLKYWLAAAILAVACQFGTALAAEPADLERGEKLWGKCEACHTYEKGGEHKVGPNLWHIFGRRAGALEDYNYSEALRESGLVWTEENLDAYLAATQDFLPGSKMYGGLAIEQNRIDLLAWLKSVTKEK